MQKNNQKLSWKKYADIELTEEDFEEINLNLKNFAKALLNINKNRKLEKGGKKWTTSLK